MVAVVVAAALAFWACVFGIYFTARGVSPIEFFLGAYDAYDPALGRWKQAGHDPQTGLIREERLLLPEGREQSRYLEKQIRYVDPRSAKVARVEPTVRLPRRRSRAT